MGSHCRCPMVLDSGQADLRHHRRSHAGRGRARAGSRPSTSALRPTRHHRDVRRRLSRSRTGSGLRMAAKIASTIASTLPEDDVTTRTRTGAWRPEPPAEWDRLRPRRRGGDPRRTSRASTSATPRTPCPSIGPYAPSTATACSARIARSAAGEATYRVPASASHRRVPRRAGGCRSLGTVSGDLLENSKREDGWGAREPDERTPPARTRSSDSGSADQPSGQCERHQPARPAHPVTAVQGAPMVADFPASPTGVIRAPEPGRGAPAESGLRRG